MEKFNYLESIFTSVKEVFKKPILLIPYLFGVVLGVAFEVWNIQFSDNPLQFLILAGGGAIALFVAGYVVYLLLSLFFTSMELAAMRQQVENKDTSVGTQFGEGLKLYLRLIGLMLIEAIMILVPIGAVVLMFALSLTPTVNAVLLAISVVIMLLVIALLVFLVLAYFYANPNLAYGRGVIDALRYSYRAMKYNKKHILLTILSTLLLGAILVAVIITISILISVGVAIGNPEAVTNPPASFQVLFSAITSLITMPFSAALTLYLFKSFKALPVKKPDFYPKVK